MVGATLYRQVRHVLFPGRGEEEHAETVRGGPLLRLIQPGMEVLSVYGWPIGPITAIWWGRDPQSPGEACDVERCSRLQVYYLTGPLYIPYSAIAAVCEGRVHLTVETTQATRGPWRYRPDWLPLMDARPSRAVGLLTFLRACPKALRR